MIFEKQICRTMNLQMLGRAIRKMTRYNRKGWDNQVYSNNKNTTGK